MADVMIFPKTVDEFMEQYKVVDTEKVYTNGTELVPIFRMKQWFEHSGSAIIEAEPVTRCKDCIYYRREIDMCDEPYSTAHNVVHEDDYCSRAERKEQKND